MAAPVPVPSVTTPKSPSAEEIQTKLSQAEEFYFNARFEESIVILRRLDLALKEQPGRISEGVKVKLQLALAHIGLNETDEARMRFEELCRLDSAYVLDPSEFAPKILRLFNEARGAARK